MTTPFEEQIRTDLKAYVGELIRCFEAGIFEGEARAAVIGALAYLVDEADLVDDEVPTIGLLDDAVAVVGLVRILVGRHDLGPVLTAERVQADHKRYMAKQGLMMCNVGAITLGALAYAGRKVSSTNELLIGVRAKIEAL